jgi:hypothetical protein
MRRSTPAAIAVVVLALAAACDHQVDHLPAQPSPSVAVGAIARGPYPRGQVTSATALDPAKRGPRIRILSPERGAQVTTPQVSVRVGVSTPNAVSSVTIDGGPTTATAGGVYEATVTLVPGTSFVPIEAIDALGQKGEAYLSIVLGQFRPIDDFAPASLEASMTSGGLARLATLIDAQAKTLDLGALLKQANPIFNQSGAEMDVVSLTNDPATATIAGAPGGANLVVEIDHVQLVLDVWFIGISAGQLTITADSVKADVPVLVNRTPAFTAAHPSSLSLEIQNVGVTFQNLAFQSSVPLVTQILAFAQQPLQQTLQSQIQTMLRTKLQHSLDTSTLAGFDTPLLVPVPAPNGTAPVELQLRIDAADGSAQTGLALELAGKATVTSASSAAITTQVLVRGTQLPLALVPTSEFALTVTDDALDTFLHAYWLAGGLSFRLDGTTKPTPFLEARILYPFFPQVRELAPDGDTPLVIELSSASPPTVALGQPGLPVELTAGEAQVRILIDYMDGGPRLELVTLRAAFQLAASLQVVGNTVQVMGLTAPAGCRVDVVNEPVTPLPDLEISNFLQQLAPFLLGQYSNKLPPIPIPALPAGLNLQRPGIAVGPGTFQVQGDL